MNCAADIHPAQKIFFEDEYTRSEFLSRQHLFWRRSDTEIVRLLQGRAVCGFTSLCTPLGLAIQGAPKPNHLGLFQAKSDLAFVSPLTAMLNVGGDHRQETHAGAIGRLHLIHPGKFSETARVHDLQRRGAKTRIHLMFVVAALGVLDTTNPGIRSRSHSDVGVKTKIR